MGHFETFNAFVDGGWPGRLAPAETAVWLSLLRRADWSDQGKAYEKLQVLAECANVKSIAYICTLRKRLVERGLLELVERGDVRKSARYLVTVPQSLTVTSHRAQLVAGRNEKRSRPTTGSSLRAQPQVVAPEDTKQNIDQHSEQNLKQTRAARTADAPIPAKLDTTEFREAWTSFLQHRRESRKPLSPTAQAALLKQLDARGVDWSVQRLDKATANGWQGVIFDEDRSTKANAVGARARRERGTYPQAELYAGNGDEGG